MGKYFAIGVMVLCFFLSYFAKRLNRWVMPILYLAAIIYFIIAAITGDVRLSIALIFIFIGLYGIYNSYRISSVMRKEHP